MKTIKDLFELILAEEMLNENKLMQYKFSIDTRYNWICMDVYRPLYEIDDDGIEQKTLKLYESVLSHASIETPEQLQQVYWTIYNNGRSSNQA